LKLNKLYAVLISFIIIYYTQATNIVKFAWDASVGGIVDHYEVVIIREGTNQEYGPYGTSNTTISIMKPKSGNYEAKVRAAWIDGLGNTQYTTWCSSIDQNCARLKDGTLGQWKIKWKLSAPTGPFIIN
jgi:hypothetical protein